MTNNSRETINSLNRMKTSTKKLLLDFKRNLGSKRIKKATIRNRKRYATRKKSR